MILYIPGWEATNFLFYGGGLCKKLRSTGLEPHRPVASQDDIGIVNSVNIAFALKKADWD